MTTDIGCVKCCMVRRERMRQKEVSTCLPYTGWFFKSRQQQQQQEQSNHTHAHAHTPRAPRATPGRPRVHAPFKRRAAALPVSAVARRAAVARRSSLITQLLPSSLLRGVNTAQTSMGRAERADFSHQLTRSVR